MGLYDRPYWREDQSSSYSHGLGAVRLGVPKPGRAVKYLLIVNLLVFILQIILGGSRINLSLWFGVTLDGWWQVWRYVTFQFLHAEVWHIGLNMLGLYMLGSPLESQWGTRRFLRFYLTCGAAAGLAYAAMAAIARLPGNMPLIGASGGVYGVLLACAVLFPGFRILFIVFPVPIRLAAIVVFGAMILQVLGGRTGSPEFWSQVAHLGGAAMGAAWLWVIPRLPGRLRPAAREASPSRPNRGAWQRRLKQAQEDQAEIDRILQKIHDQGILSLTAREKRTLQEATRRQQAEEDQAARRP